MHVPEVVSHQAHPVGRSGRVLSLTMNGIEHPLHIAAILWQQCQLTPGECPGLLVRLYLLRESRRTLTPHQKGRYELQA